MLVCPGCHLGLAPALPTLQPPSPQPSPPPAFTPCTASAHWVSTAHLTPGGGVQPPYVCGRMFQVGGVAAVRPCVTVQHDACHVLCCLACPHACPTLRSCLSKAASCALPEARSSLHTSGGGLLVEGQTAERGGSGVASDAKVSLNPFRASSPPTKPPTDAASSVRLSPPPPPPAKEPDDSQVLTQTRRALEESGWYYGALSCEQAATLLQETAVGTFLLRDSASPQCLYSLSVQTRNGPTSVRIHYSCGKFRLDCTGHSQRHMPEFDGVVPLVEHYVRVTSTQVWVDHEGKTFSPIDIRRPLLRAAPSLQHLCRLALNTSSSTAAVAASSTSSLPLPPALRTFLRSYPHSC